MTIFDSIKISFILISTYNKDKILFLSKNIDKRIPKTKFIATSGSYVLLKDHLSNVSTIEEFTGYEELPEGLVKTLHPKIFFGFLSKPQDEKHVKALEKINSNSIDLLVCNLYPFDEIKDKKLKIEELTHYWDIGGPSMIMAAIKGNHTCVLTDPNQYEEFLDNLSDSGTISMNYIKKMNKRALNYVVQYHKMIETYFEENY